VTTNSDNTGVHQGLAPGASPEPAAADTYHDHESALAWAIRLESAAWFPLILAVLSALLLVVELITYLPQVIGAGGLENYLGVSLPLLIPLEAAVVAASLFVIMRAASQALLLLLDIQDKPALP
jgi:hypothetical protein